MSNRPGKHKRVKNFKGSLYPGLPLYFYCYNSVYNTDSKQNFFAGLHPYGTWQKWRKTTLYCLHDIFCNRCSVVFLFHHVPQQGSTPGCFSSLPCCYTIYKFNSLFTLSIMTGSKQSSLQYLNNHTINIYKTEALQLAWKLSELLKQEN